MEIKKPKPFIPGSHVVAKNKYKKGMLDKRGPDWFWPDEQDDNGTSIGKVIKYSHKEMDPISIMISDWVIVKWEKTEIEGFYRIGPNKFDLIET